MKITINDHRKVSAIQQEFSDVFSNLKLEFHLKPSKVGGSASTKWVKGGGKSLADCRATHEEGVIEIQPAMAVHDLQEHFRDRYGLSVVVLLKSETNFDQTVVTEKLSLEDQNMVTL